MCQRELYSPPRCLYVPCDRAHKYSTNPWRNISFNVRSSGLRRGPGQVQGGRTVGAGVAAALEQHRDVLLWQEEVCGGHIVSQGGGATNIEF